MEYSRIVAVTGLSGLFELMSSKSDGGVVRSLEDNSVKFVSTRVHNFSHLESIEIYTVKENVNLADIFIAMKGSAEKLPDANDSKAVKAYFEKVYPDMDLERVYNSDMKKMLRWYGILDKMGIEIKLSTPDEGGEDELAGDVKSDKKEKADKDTKSKSAAVKEPKVASVKNAPAKKVNAPRKMA